MTSPSRRHLAGVALVSATLLMTELALTRIFSVVMYYHFAFLAISIAPFGVGASGGVVWTRLGLADFERAWRQLQSEEVSWLGGVRVLLNQVGPHSFHGVSRVLERDYRLEVIGELPYVPSYWQQVELTRTLQALSVEIQAPEASGRTDGQDAARFRAARAELGQKLVAESLVALGTGGRG